jgi:hypothetical protein
VEERVSVAVKVSDAPALMGLVVAVTASVVEVFDPAAAAAVRKALTSSEPRPVARS